MIGIAQPGLSAFEPAFVDELSVLMRWSFEHMQKDDGGSVYLRLSTRAIDQPTRTIAPSLEADIVAGAYWYRQPGPGSPLAIAYCGAIAPEAIEAHRQVLEDIPEAGLLAVTSADRLYADWNACRRSRATSHIERLLSPLAAGASLVTVIDGHPLTLAWLGSVAGHRVQPLGVDRFGQTGDLPDIHAAYGLDVDAILDAAARTFGAAAP